ncbi:MAG: hypothetical protein HIU84_12520 [Acidobacteria bacterium]|nr:hypothetical protein [Acidobacteriota bacterium]
MPFLRDFRLRRRVVTAAAVIVVISGVTVGVTLHNSAGNSDSHLSFHPYSFSSAKVTPPNAQQVTPNVLPASDGLLPNAGWTLVGTSADSMYIAPASGVSTTTSSPGSAQAGTATASSVGLNGSLYQLWVPSAAITMFGTLGNGLQLPLPTSYTQGNPGPNEITVQVFSFDNASEAGSLYLNPNFSDASMNAQQEGFTALPGSFINNGNAASYQSASLAGLDTYQFQWTVDGFWVQVSIVGSSMTLAQAQSVASEVAV